MYDGLTWTQQQTLFQDLLSDENEVNLTMGKTLIRQGQKRLEAILGIYFTEKTVDITTVTDAIADTDYQDYKLPMGFKKLRALYVTVGTVQYPATLIQDEDFWRELNSSAPTNDILSLCFIRRDRVSLYPIPSSAQTMTMIYDSTTVPLTQEDHADGTITTLANGASAVTGASTNFTAAMVGRYFKIDDDGRWYKISAYTAATAITLDTEYEGVSIAAGTDTYSIGQMPDTPPETHELPVYYACWKYSLFRKDVQLAREFERTWKEGIDSARADWANRSASSVFDDLPLSRGRGLINPNKYPEGMT